MQFGTTERELFMVTRIFRTTIFRDESACFIPISFDPRAVFGKVRAPVKVTLNGYTYHHRGDGSHGLHSPSQEQP